jgi:hypothetical protein
MDEATGKRAIQLAGAALRAAMAGDWGAAGAAIQAASDECGGGGVELCVRSWCDTTINRFRQVTGTPANAPVRPVWVQADTSRVYADADEVPPAVRWAGRVMAARASLDREAYEALLESIPHDDVAVGEHLHALLDSAAQTLRRLLEALQ